MTIRLSLSIALASYNGEQYIREQLDSIANQTRLPDELVVSDDASVDSTIAIVEDFARSAPFPVHLRVNGERLGTLSNFETAIRACRGDIIFLCDQDDVWYTDKVALIEEHFSDPKIGAVFSDGDVVDQNLHPFDRLWKVFKFSLKEQDMISAGNALGVLLKHSVVTGATLAFRSNYRDLVLPLPDLPETWHDEWIALLIGATSSLVALRTPLIAYRQHGSNQVGIRKKNRDTSPAAIYGPRVMRVEAARMRLLENADSFSTDERIIKSLDGALAFLRSCSALPRSRWRRLPYALRELAALRYHRYANGLKSFRKDLLR